MDATHLAFAYKQHPLRVQLIDAVAWYDLTYLCALLGRPSLDDAVAFVGAAHPERLRGPAGDSGGTPWIDDDGLWSVVSLAGYRFADDVSRWLHQEVAPKIRHAIYELTPNGNPAEVRELWHVIDQLLETGEMKDYGRDTDTLAINVSEMLLAAFRCGHSLPGKAKTTHLLALSKTPSYRGQMRIAHGDRELVCLAFKRRWLNE